MRLAYTILYVPDVAGSLAFYEHAFGLKRRFLHENGTYGELETGATALAFAAEEIISHAYAKNRPDVFWARSKYIFLSQATISSVARLSSRDYGDRERFCSLN